MILQPEDEVLKQQSDVNQFAFFLHKKRKKICWKIYIYKEILNLREICKENKTKKGIIYYFSRNTNQGKNDNKLQKKIFFWSVILIQVRWFLYHLKIIIS